MSPEVNERLTTPLSPQFDSNLRDLRSGTNEFESQDMYQHSTEAEHV